MIFSRPRFEHSVSLERHSTYNLRSTHVIEVILATRTFYVICLRSLQLKTDKYYILFFANTFCNKTEDLVKNNRTQKQITNNHKILFSVRGAFFLTIHCCFRHILTYVVRYKIKTNPFFPPTIIRFCHYLHI